MVRRSGRKMYFDLLELHPVAISMSFSVGNDTTLLAQILPDMYLFGFVKRMLEAAGTVLSGIDQAPISIKALIARHVFETKDILSSRIIAHYMQQVSVCVASFSVYPWLPLHVVAVGPSLQFLWDFYKILGSGEWIGNPVGLLKNVGVGVFNLFYEPAQVSAVLCCAVLCCAVLCCAVLCCAVLCCAVLCCDVM
jgi:hypothetical protein